MASHTSDSQRSSAPKASAPNVQVIDERALGTHWRTGTCGMTWSTRCAVVCAFRRALHEGQKPRRLQLNTTSLLWPQPPQSPQRSRRKPWARTAAFEEGVELVLARSAASRRRTRLRPGRRRSQRAAAPGGTAWSASGRWRSQLTGAPSGARCTSIARMPPTSVCPTFGAAVRIPTPARRRRHAGGLHGHPREWKRGNLPMPGMKQAMVCHEGVNTGFEPNSSLRISRLAPLAESRRLLHHQSGIAACGPDRPAASIQPDAVLLTIARFDPAPRAWRANRDQFR